MWWIFIFLWIYTQLFQVVKLLFRGKMKEVNEGGILHLVESCIDEKISSFICIIMFSVINRWMNESFEFESLSPSKRVVVLVTTTKNLEKQKIWEEEVEVVEAFLEVAVGVVEEVVVLEDPETLMMVHQVQ